MRGFVDALLVEAHTRQREHNIKPRTIYFGGGTPSMMSDRHLGRLFDGLRDIFDWNDVTEVTFEANPATFNARRACFFSSLGITRMSLGIQSWDEEVLKVLGREHSPEQAEESIHILREAGIPEINIDLMFSIPGQSLATWEQSLKKTISLRPEHISAYNLSYEEDTEFFEMLNAGKWSTSEEQDALFFERTHEVLTRAGYRHYETSNFARDGFLSRHNLSYWEGEDYMGLGPGAVGTLNHERMTNTCDTRAYIAGTRQNGLPSFETEKLSPLDFNRERIALLLRTDIGLPLDYIPGNRNDIIREIVREGLASTSENKIFLTDKGRLLVDEIAVQFF